VALSCACSTTVAGSGSAGPTPSRVSTASGSTPTAAPTTLAYLPPDTDIGNPRTANLCSVIAPDKLTKFGETSPTLQLSPVDCEFYVTPANASADVEMSAYVYGPYDYDPTGTGVESRVVSGETVYAYPFARHDCRAMISTSTVVIGVQAQDYSSQLDAGRVCAMRDALVAQVAAGVAKHRPRHLSYGPTSLTSVVICDHVDVASLPPFSHNTGMSVYDRAFGNECDLTNSVYWVDIWIGLHPPPVEPMSGRRLTVDGHHLVQEFKATSTYCQVTSQQDNVPDTIYSETVEVSAEVRAGHPADVPNGSALCSEVAGPVLTAFLEETGRK